MPYPHPSFRGGAHLLLFAATTAMPAAAAAGVVINEIHYNGEPNTAQDEFVELLNTGPGEVDLSGWFFSDGVSFEFPEGTVVPEGGFAVVAMRPESVPGSIGPYSGQLDGDGETVVLRDRDGFVVDRVEYSNEFPWPVGAGGTGASMELVNPGLDNDLGGSWRSSPTPGAQEAAVLVDGSSAGWSWRQGSSEASAPVDAWRETGFAEDGSWEPATTPVGYAVDGVNGMTMNTLVTGMQGNYTSFFARRTFEVAPGETPLSVSLRFGGDDGIVIWINGTEVARHQVDGATTAASGTASSSENEGVWQTVVRDDAATFIQEGTNTVAVQVYNDAIGSSDAGFDLVLERLASGGDDPPVPTPGAPNGSFSDSAPPQTRQVRHTPALPGAGAPAVVTAKVTDPDGVGSVALEFQVVEPGDYISAYLAKPTAVLNRFPNDPLEPNPRYHDPANWTGLAMRDDGSGGDAVAGDGVYSATLPGQDNRTLVRYRITVEDGIGNSVRVPYADDPSLNFAYYVYDGVPDYVASTRSVLGAVPQTHGSDVLSALPVYQLLTTGADYDQCVGYNSRDQISRDNYDARSSYNWPATFVYGDEVYDNIKYRLRQRNARYTGSGKRSFKFRFNRGRYAQLHDQDGDPYPTKWRLLASHRMSNSRGNIPTWGLEQAANHELWNMVGVPASYTHWFHFRVVKSPEGGDQYSGDFYGALLAMEEFDKRFLDAHDLEPGNLYKLISGRTNGVDVRRYQAPTAVDDGSDFRNIINRLRPNQDDAWLNDHVNYDRWNWYHTVVDAVRHYDLSSNDDPNNGEHLKNQAYYFEPAPGSEFGRLWVLPWDSDTSWGYNWNGGVDWAKFAIWNRNTGFTRPGFGRDYQNVVREFRDLIWTPEQIDLLLDPMVERLAPFVAADRDRWTRAPSSAGSQNDPDIMPVAADMKQFAFDGGRWDGGTWGGGAASRESMDSGLSGREGRDAFLDWLAEDADIPATPVVTYTGAAGFPQGGIAFGSSAFADPQGAGTFGTMEYRVAEVSDELGVPEMEWNAEWESGELAGFTPEVAVPASEVRPGRTYRARVRHQDDTGRWSHWSSPVEFTVTAPDTGAYAALVVSEVMYHPTPPSPAERTADPTLDSEDFEWVELFNTGAEPLELSAVRFTKGVDFDFAGGPVTVLAPGARAVVVRNPAAFNLRYGFAETPGFVAGEFSKNLANGGELVRLSFGAGTVLREFTYDDASPWPTEPDGGGVSLVLVGPEGLPDHAEAASWTAGAVPGGTPGAGEPGGFTGDPEADGDGDGRVALLEFGTGGDDTTPGDAMDNAVVVEGAGDTATFLVPRNPGAGGIVFVFEVTTDLEHWTALPFGGWESPGVARYSAPIGEATLYGRTRVELP